jgi:hypothetical protein
LKISRLQKGLQALWRKEYYQGLKKQIDEFIAKEQSQDDEYVPFVVENFIKNPAAQNKIRGDTKGAGYTNG